MRVHTSEIKDDSESPLRGGGTGGARNPGYLKVTAMVADEPVSCPFDCLITNMMPIIQLNKQFDAISSFCAISLYLIGSPGFQCLELFTWNKR